MGHYEERMERDLADLRQRVGAIAERLDVAIVDATRSMLERDHALAAKTILGDLPINRASRALDHQCHTFVARHLPSAGTLRFISAVLRISTALERVGDYAAAVAREAVQMRSTPPSVVARDIEMMSEQARNMLKQAHQAFQDLNSELARGTMAMESQADSSYRKVRSDLLSEGEHSEVAVRDLFAYLATFNRLERITDQAKNLCEETIFAATGEGKTPKQYRVLFVDQRGAGPALMAHAIARKNFPESGRYTSEGLEPAESLDPGFLAYMEQRGLDIGDLGPRAFATGFETLRGHHVVVALAPGVAEHIAELPYSTVLLDWSAEIAAAGPHDALEDEHREALFKLLSPRIRDLMETLRGEQAC